MPDETHHRVVVLGGALVSVFSARHLRRRARSGVEMLRISRHDFFVSQPLLAEVTDGTINPSDGMPLLRRSLPGVAVTEAEVLESDRATETVEATLGGVSGTRTSSCDQLVIALGQAVASSRTPGLAACALLMKDPMDPPASTLVAKIH